MDKVKALQAVSVDRETTKPHSITGKGENQYLFDVQKWTYEIPVPFFWNNYYIKFTL